MKIWRNRELYLRTYSNLNISFYRDISIGDIVTIGECRPLSKTVRFNVLKVIKVSGSKKAFDKFWEGQVH